MSNETPETSVNADSVSAVTDEVEILLNDIKEYVSNSDSGDCTLTEKLEETLLNNDKESIIINALDLANNTNNSKDSDDNKSLNSLDKLNRSTLSINSNNEQTISPEQEEINRLREQIKLRESDCANFELKLNECEQQAKAQVEQLHQNFTLKLEQTLKKFQESQKDKTSSMVMKYAEAEKRCIDLNRNIDLLQSKLNDSAKEKQRLNERLNKSKDEYDKLNQEHDKRLKEIMNLKKENNKFKEQLVVNDAREKAAQLKLKNEYECHLNTKRLLEHLTIELNEIKKKINTDNMTSSNENVDTNGLTVNTNESDEVRSASVSPKVESSSETAQAVNEPTTSPSESISVKTEGAIARTAEKDRTIRELYALKSQLKDMFEERATLRDRLQCMEQERKLQETSLGKYKETLQNQKQMNKDLFHEIIQLRESQESMEKQIREKGKLEEELEQLKIELNELQSDLKSSEDKQNELLTFTSKLTEKNTHLQSENSVLNEKLQQIQEDFTKLDDSSKESSSTVKTELDELNRKIDEQKNQIEALKKQLEEKTKEVQDLSVKLSDEQDENMSLKKKHAANVKDLSRQIQMLQKKMNNSPSSNSIFNSSSAPLNTSTGSNSDQASINSMPAFKTPQQHPVSSANRRDGSRTSSISSLNDKDHPFSDSHSINTNLDRLNDDDSRSSDSNNRSLSNIHPGSSYSSRYNNELICGNEDVYVVDIDKQKIIEKIVKLQKTLAKRNEKIDFLQDHVNQLTNDLKRKTKIIQAYAMSEEVGAFTSEAQDAIKREMSRKTGIMSTLYKTNKSYYQTAQFINSNESNMTMELSLEINSKLQALLEDTLMKNLTLKESIETLGQEIARLSKENRQIRSKE